MTDITTRCVDGMLTSEVTPVTIRIHPPPPPRSPKVMVMVKSNQFTSLLFQVNRPLHSWDKAVSNFNLENSRSRPWVWSKVKVTYLTKYQTNALPFFMSIRPTIPKIWPVGFRPWKIISEILNPTPPPPKNNKNKHVNRKSPTYELPPKFNQILSMTRVT